MASIIRFNVNDIVDDTQKVAVSTWTDNTNNLQVAHTSSTQANFDTPTSSGAFFIDIHNKATTDTTSKVQYSIAYGHKDGSGSLNFTNDTGAKGKSSTGVTYAQYRNLVFGDETRNFSFDGTTPKDIFILNINRANYRHNLKPGTLNLQLTGSSLGSPVGKLHLTDDSITKTGSAVVTNLGRQFNIVSGTNGVRLGSTLTQSPLTSTQGSYGLFYPDAGIIILNGRALSHSLHLEGSQADNAAPNATTKLRDAISGSEHFIIDSEERISSQFYFVRATNGEFNYTTNPSFIDAQGNLNFDSMIDNPTTFITTVGLYNDANDLVAVAKLSQPVQKDFTKEALIRVKLDY